MSRTLRTSPAVFLAALLGCVPIAAQQRSTVKIGPSTLGSLFFVEHDLPDGLAGHIAGFFWSAPFAGAIPVPGLVNGLLRIDPSNFTLLGLAVTNGVSSPRMSLVVPNSTALVSAQLDCQSFDVDSSATFWLSGNDVALTIEREMVAISPGTFSMGSPVTPLDVPPYYNQPESRPVHSVTIARPFWIGRHEVTQRQFQSVMGFNPSFHQGIFYPDASLRPVDSVTWEQALAYCSALTLLERAAGNVPAHHVYRLPTEAEWEYCCRAGTITEFHYGTALNCGQANFIFSDHSNAVCPSPEGDEPLVVGAYQRNAFGLHDMHGNVDEWCLDAWDFLPNYPSSAVTDPFVAEGDVRIIRGGTYFDDSNYCRSAARWGDFPDQASDGTGFRVVLAPVLLDPTLDLVAISPGAYQQGSSVTPLNVTPYFNQSNAQPVRNVTISWPFWIGKYEVTQAQYQSVMGTNPSFHQGAAYPNASQRPVEQVSWNSAVAFCQALTAREQDIGRLPAGYVYRLPTEAEWEYCCRAGTTTEFHNGSTLVCGQANFALSQHSGVNCSVGQTKVKGSHAANALGLHDMHGNVWEWCHDGWDGASGYAPGAVTNPVVNAGAQRVRRGGSWNSSSTGCRSAFRGGVSPTGTGPNLGFRIVLAPALP